MTTQTLDSDDRARRVGEVLAVYFESLDAGYTPSRRALLGQHPDLAGDLAAYFAEHDQFQCVLELMEPIGDNVGRRSPIPPPPSATVPSTRQLLTATAGRWP